jgi:hypothetical protein
MRRGAWLAGVVLAVLLATRVHAQVAPKVLLIEPADPELAARIAGQTRDLPLTFATTSTEPDVGAARAQALAKQQGAVAVVWVVPRADGGVEVHVFDAVHGSERTREVPKTPEGDELGGSAVFEAAALVVRGELGTIAEQAASAGGPGPGSGSGSGPRSGSGSGPRPGSDSDSDPGSDTDSGSDTDTDTDTDSGSDTDSSARIGAWSVRAAARGSLIASDEPTVGPLVGLGLDLPPFSFGLQATTTLPLHFERDGVAVTLRRHAVMLHALAFAYDGRSFRLLAGIDGGVVLYARSTDRRSGMLMPTSDRTTFSAAFGAVGELQWLPTPTLGAALDVGLDLLTAPVELALQRTTGPEVLRRLSWYEPWATLSIVFHFGAPPPAAK